MRGKKNWAQILSGPNFIKSLLLGSFLTLSAYGTFFWCSLCFGLLGCFFCFGFSYCFSLWSFFLCCCFLCFCHDVVSFQLLTISKFNISIHKSIELLGIIPGNVMFFRNKMREFPDQHCHDYVLALH